MFGIIGGPLFSIIFGIVGLRRTKRRGTPGRGLAIAGIILGAVWVVLIGAFVATYLREQPTRAPGGGITAAGDVTWRDLRVGDCVRSLDTGTVVTIPVGPCSEPHAGEVFEVTFLAEGPWPGEEEVKRLAEGACQRALPSYVSAPPGAPGYAIHYLRPLETSWSNDRRVVCIAHDPSGAPLSSSVRGAGPLSS